VRWVDGLRQRRSVVALVTAGLIAYGLLALFHLPRGIYPEVDFPRVVIVAHVGDLPPEVVQTTATRPLEEAVATVPHLRRLRSRTIRGATELSAQFEPGTNMWRALQLVETQVAEVRSELPEGVELRVERVTPTAMPLVTFNVTGDVDPRVLYETARYVIRPALTRISGVGEVQVQGGDERELQVVLRPADVAALHVTPSKVADAVAASNVVVAVGRAYAEHQVLTVMAASEPTTPAEIAQLPIASGPNAAIPLSAVADVIDGTRDRVVSVAGRSGDTVVVTVSRAPGASAPDVVHRARTVIDELVAARALPQGVRVNTVYDQSELIDDAMGGVRDAILLGVALSLIVLAVFLRDPRAGLAAAVAVPITLAWTFGAIDYFGQTLNLMSLGGLAVAIGLVVDDAIVIVEAIVCRLEDGETVGDAAANGTRDLLAAVVGTTVTTVVVFAPMVALSGVVGSFFAALAVTLAAAVVLSLVVSVTIVPVVAALLLRRASGARRAEAPGARMAAAYGRLLRRLIRRPALGAVGVVAIGVLGVLASRQLTTGFLPHMDEGAMVVDFFLPQGTSLEETDRIGARLDHILATTPGVVRFTRRTGAEMGPAAATQQNRGDILVRLAPRDERASVYAIMDRVRERAAREVPEARVEFVQVLQDVLDDLSGNPSPLEVRIFGPDQRVLERTARQVAKRIEGLPALEDLFDGVEGNVPVLRVDVDPGAARKLGVTPAEIAADLEVALGGRVATQVRVGDRNIGLRVRMPDGERFNTRSIETMPLAYGGAVVPLSAVARVSRPVGPSVLLRENLSPVIMVTAAIRPDADLADTGRRVRELLADLHLPEGYHYEVGGQLESAHQTQVEMARVFALGVVLLLTVLLVQLRSLRLALVVLLGAPLALVGAVLTLVATGVPLDASSMMGCVLLAGLVVKNGILLLENAQLRAARGVDFRQAVAEAGARRLRPILMTTAATVAGLLPLAFGFGAGSELQRPLALATIGGLLLSTLVTLLAVPSLASALHRRRDSH
jgi:CzcA family heavy metal efflux pump